MATRGAKRPRCGVHDPLYARTMLLKSGQAAWSLTVLDLLDIDAKTVNQVRRIAAEATGLKPQTIMVSCIHTHSAPSASDLGNWDVPPAELIARGVIAAWKSLQPARLGASAGFLYGYHVNRRWMERPVDPSVNVARFDDLQGKPIGVAANFGLHAVVMGYDKYPHLCRLRGRRPPGGGSCPGLPVCVCQRGGRRRQPHH